MGLFKLGDKIWSLSGDGDIHLLAELDHIPEQPTFENQKQLPVVRLQSKNRRDEVQLVGGKPVKISHGVYELDVFMSEKFRWFISIMGASLGIIDVDDKFSRRDEIERAIEAEKARMAIERLRESGLGNGFGGAADIPGGPPKA